MVMPSILKTKERRVLRYFNKYGFTKIILTIYIMDNSASLDEVVELEQHFIDSLTPAEVVVGVTPRGKIIILAVSSDVKKQKNKKTKN